MLKRAALVSPGFLPVPAVEGGAVEVLMTCLIEGNEVNPQFEIDVYTIPSKKFQSVNYRYSHIKEVKPFFPRIVYRILNKARNMIYRFTRVECYRYVNEYLIYKAIRKHQYELVIIQNNMNIYDLIYRRTRNKNNLIFHLHNDVGDVSKSRKSCELIGRTAKQVITVSRYIKERFLTAAPQSNVNVLYNCVDSDSFSPGINQERKALREKYHIAPGEVVFMFSGRAVPEKGVKELLEAFLRICSNTNSRLLIVGSAWYNLVAADEYLKMVIRLAEPMKDRIIFTGYIYPEEMPKMYQIADVVVIPSVWEEPFGVVALEAMAMKKPMIISESGGLPEVVNLANALFVKKNSDFVSQLAEKMKLLAGDKSLREKLGYAAYHEFTQHPEFAKKNYFNNFIQLLYP